MLPVSLLLRDSTTRPPWPGGWTRPCWSWPAVATRSRSSASHSRRLFNAAPQPKRLVVLDGADHNDDELLAGPRLLAELRTFLGVGGLRG